MRDYLIARPLHADVRHRLALIQQSEKSQGFLLLPDPTVKNPHIEEKAESERDYYFRIKSPASYPANRPTRETEKKDDIPNDSK